MVYKLITYLHTFVKILFNQQYVRIKLVEVCMITLEVILRKYNNGFTSCSAVIFTLKNVRKCLVSTDQFHIHHVLPPQKLPKKTLSKLIIISSASQSHFLQFLDDRLTHTISQHFSDAVPRIDKLTLANATSVTPRVPGGSRARILHVTVAPSIGA